MLKKSPGPTCPGTMRTSSGTTTFSTSMASWAMAEQCTRLGSKATDLSATGRLDLTTQHYQSHHCRFYQCLSSHRTGFTTTVPCDSALLFFLLPHLLSSLFPLLFFLLPNLLSSLLFPSLVLFSLFPLLSPHMHDWLNSNWVFHSGWPSRKGHGVRPGDGTPLGDGSHGPGGIYLDNGSTGWNCTENVFSNITVWALACYTGGIDNNSFTNNTYVCGDWCGPLGPKVAASTMVVVPTCAVFRCRIARSAVILIFQQ